MISIIVPLYNLEAYCTPCLDSLRNQTYKDIEIVLVNDGSTDATGAICHRYAEADPRFRVIDKLNEGVAAARNTGLEAAHGEYIMFADGDDIVSPYYAEFLLSKMRDGVILATCAFERISTYDIPVFRAETGMSEKTAVESAALLLKGRFPVSAWGAIFLANKVKECKFPVGIRNNEDKYFVFQYLIKNSGVVVRSDAVLYDYFVRENSATTSKFNGRTDVAVVADKMLEDVCAMMPALKNDATRSAVSCRLKILHQIAGSKHEYSEYKDLFYGIKREVFSMSNGVKLSRQDALELIALRMGALPYRMLVGAYYKHASDRMRYKRNEKRMALN